MPVHATSRRVAELHSAMKALTRWLMPRSAAKPDAAPTLPLDLSGQCIADDPHHTYRWLRENMPVAPVAGGGYLLTRHADVMAAFTDDRLGNAPSRFAVLHPRRADPVSYTHLTLPTSDLV